MMAIAKKLLYILASLFVIGFWKLSTLTDNYAFFPQGKELLILDIALTSIFIYKTIFWLIVANLTILSIQKFIVHKYKIGGFVFSVVLVFYFVAGYHVDKECAFHYYKVFVNQSVTEDHLTRPIVEAGYQIGPIVTEEIAGKEMKYRRYAIEGLGKIKYKPATPTLTKILLDKGELDVFRADAYEALSTFDTDESGKILEDFKKQSTDSLDKKVVELGEYFIMNK